MCPRPHDPRDSELEPRDPASRSRSTAAVGDDAQISRQLAEWARQPPDPMLPASCTAGHELAARLAADVAGTQREAAFRRAVVGLFDGGDLRCCWLGAFLARTGEVPPTQVAAAFAQAETKRAELAYVSDPAFAELHAALGSLWARTVAAGLLPWESSMRARVGEPWALPLLGAALLFDHPWAVAELEVLLGPGDFAVPRFAAAVRTTLRRSEAEVLRDELRAQPPSEVRRACAEAVAWMLERDGILAEGPVRWSPT